MIDKALIFINVLTFIVFVIGIALAVRISGQEGILKYIKKFFLVSYIAGSILIWITFDIKGTTKALLLFVYFLLYWSTCFAYVLGLLGLPITSLRIQLLILLSSYGKRGTSVRALVKKYSRVTILKNRIARLESSGEIVKHGSHYFLHSKWSYFLLHNYFLLFLLKLYRPMKNNKSQS